MRSLFNTCLVVTMLVPLLAVAAPKEKKPRPYVKVDSVSAADNTVTITDLDQSNRTYVVDGFTKITVNGNAAKLNDVESGMKADISVAGGGKKLSRLEVTDSPEVKAEKKKKK
ncbi:MAG: hypothetical protein PCFJNLEI_01537 [Verrucomicrobiae bacterium]|nr:hypothetical protein [Verrucomicrobiae bacterium]